jgi:hypothetical protein
VVRFLFLSDQRTVLGVSPGFEMREARRSSHPNDQATFHQTSRTPVFYRAIDEISHHFMHYHPPQMAGIPDEDFEIYQ